MDRICLKATEVAVALGVARSKAYALMADGTLPVLRIGRNVRVPKDALEEWVRSRTHAPTAEVPR